jgi:hypothetical protein
MAQGYGQEIKSVEHNYKRWWEEKEKKKKKLERLP